MTDKEKILELLKGAERKVKEQLTEPLSLNEWLDIYADHLIENGVIVPPCKVGDVVWDRNGEPHKVNSIEWYSKKVMHLHCEKHTFSVGKRSIGKTVFLTKEEAENVLRKEDEGK